MALWVSAGLTQAPTVSCRLGSASCPLVERGLSQDDGPTPALLDPIAGWPGRVLMAIVEEEERA